MHHVLVLRQSSQSLQLPKECGFPTHGCTDKGSTALTLGLEVQDDGSVHRRHRQGERAISQLHVQAHQPQVVLPVQGPHGLGKGGSSCSQQISQQEPLMLGYCKPHCNSVGQPAAKGDCIKLS